jgi:predicted xylose isomerase-like sugar epimerase
MRAGRRTDHVSGGRQETELRRERAAVIGVERKRFNGLIAEAGQRAEEVLRQAARGSAAHLLLLKDVQTAADGELEIVEQRDLVDQIRSHKP